MPANTADETFRYESPAPAAEPCSRIEVTAVLIVRADVPLGTTGEHLAEYVGSLLENRKHNLHENTFDGLESADMRVHGRGAEPNRLMSCAARLVQEEGCNIVLAGPLGDHAAEVRALLRWHRHSKVAKAWGWRMDDFAGLFDDAFAGEVCLSDCLYTIADIGLRMLQPRELYRAQGFPDSYIIGDDPSQGLLLTKTQQVSLCGNSVPPDVEAAIVAANYTEDSAQREGRELPLLGVGR